MRTSTLLTSAAALCLGAIANAQITAPEIGDLQKTNLGEWRPVVFNGHDLTPPAADGGFRVLYAPSESDDAAYRAAIAATIGGGAVVDYFDARAATPSVALLMTYDATHTWANFAYADNVAFGDNLAAYNDAGGHVVLGVFCTFTSGNFLSGQIMTAAYSPVFSPTGGNHFSNASYAGDGTSCIYNGVASLSSTFRDMLATQGNGVADGTYTDGEICHAFRTNTPSGSGEVVYSNGGGASPLFGGGDWAVAVGNSSECGPGGPPCMNPSSCTFHNGTGVNPTGFTCGTNPIIGKTWVADVSTIPTSGLFSAATLLAIGSGPTSGTFALGGEILALPPFTFDVADGVHAIPIPDDAMLLGGNVTVQAVRFEWPNAIVLLNAQDIIIGCQ